MFRKIVEKEIKYYFLFSKLDENELIVTKCYKLKYFNFVKYFEILFITEGAFQIPIYFFTF